ncbi:MAG TPA: hypothetical protein VIJ85_11585 [Rhizomicrobium sp.]
MDSFYDWLNLVTAIFLGKAGGIAGALAIIGALVAVGAAIFQSEGFARMLGVFLVLVSIAFAGWIIARPNHYRAVGQYGFRVDVPTSLAVVDWESDRITLAGGEGGDRASLRTGAVPMAQALAFLQSRRQRALKFASDRKGTVRLDAGGPGFIFTRWTEAGSPDDAAIDHFSGVVMRRDGSDIHWASFRATMDLRSSPLRARDYTRIRQSLCDSAGIANAACVNAQ